jgi:hypothetical protein
MEVTEMTRGKTILLSCFLVLVLVSGCATGKKTLKQMHFKPVELSEKGISVGLVHPTEEELIEQFGLVDNPFLPAPSLLGAGPSLVFELSIETATDLRVYLSSMEFHMGNRFLRPVSPSHFAHYWDTRIPRDDRYRGWTSGKVLNRINDHMLPSRLKLKAGESVRGFVVFSGSLPNQGEAAFYLPVYSPQDELIHTFKF